MVRAGKIVTERLAGVLAEENSTGVMYFIISSNGFFVTISRCSGAMASTVSIAS